MQSYCATTNADNREVYNRLLDLENQAFAHCLKADSTIPFGDRQNRVWWKIHARYERRKVKRFSYIVNHPEQFANKSGKWTPEYVRSVYSEQVDRANMQYNWSMREAARFS